MANELSGMLDNNKIEQSEKYCSQEKPSFLETVIKPIYNALKAVRTLDYSVTFCKFCQYVISFGTWRNRSFG